MLDRVSQAPSAHDADVIARAIGALALAALAVIHVVDLPGTLGPDRLVGFGYFGIIVAAVMIAGAMINRSHRLVWAAAGALAASDMGGYLLTRSLPGGFLGDHGDVGNWRCPLGITDLSVDTLIILLAVLATWQARSRAARTSSRPRLVVPRTPEYGRSR
jgi:hypothetical protein